MNMFSKNTNMIQDKDRNSHVQKVSTAPSGYLANYQMNLTLSSINPPIQIQEIHTYKQIMLSYSRQEAAHHAIILKESLNRRGFDVYLDIHEIEMGSDWSDSLNRAIQNCYFFVPLITPNYGTTLWTSREFKLAYFLQKNILPISFLNSWPPQCLAIQLVTTQYIPWRPLKKNAKKSTNFNDKTWNPESIKHVTDQLVKQITKLSQKKSSKDLKLNDAKSNIDRPGDVVTIAETSSKSTSPFYSSFIKLLCMCMCRKRHR